MRTARARSVHDGSTPRQRPFSPAPAAGAKRRAPCPAPARASRAAPPRPRAGHRAAAGSRRPGTRPARPPGDVAEQLSRRQPRLRLGLRPGAVHPLHVGTEEPAHAREAVDVLALAPSVLGLGPFERAPHVADPGAGLDRGAEDAARHRGLELAADGGGGRLVGQRQALLDVAPGEEPCRLRRPSRTPEGRAAPAVPRSLRREWPVGLTPRYHRRPMRWSPAPLRPSHGPGSLPSPRACVRRA